MAPLHSAILKVHSPIANGAGADDDAGVRALCAASDHARATEVVLALYGRELFGFLLARFRDQPSLADDAFSELTEDMVRGLPGFAWRCSLRSWCYRLARSAASRVGHDAARRRRYVVPWTGSSEVHPAAAPSRTVTATFLQTPVRDAFAQIRAALSPDDRELLTLRMDRGLSWREVAIALTNVPLADSIELARQEVALRQRLADVKKRLRKLAAEAGLL